MTSAAPRAAVALLLLAAAGAPRGRRAAGAAAAVGPGDASYTYTVGPFIAEYEPPPPGSYTLPVIERVDDHALLDSSGAATSLAALKGNRLAVVAFVYTTCAEAAGCPLAEAIMQRLDRRLADDPALAGQVRLLTISFDPERDTPARMATIRGAFDAQDRLGVPHHRGRGAARAHPRRLRPAGRQAEL